MIKSLCSVRKRYEYRALPLTKVSSCWECPKCGRVKWKDLKAVEVDGEFRLRHSCGSLCAPRQVNSEFRSKVR